jgi:hypothetical protein
VAGFWQGVTVAVIGGLIIWGGSEAWTTYKKDRMHIATYGLDEKAIIVTPELKRVVSQLDKGSQVAVVTIKNEGRDDFSPLNIRIRDEIESDGSGIIEFGQLGKIGEKVEDVKLSKDAGAINAIFPLLRPGEGAKIWVSNKGFSIFDVSNNQPETKLEKADDSPTFFESDFFLYILVGFCSLVLGIIISEIGNRHVLRKIGFDPDEVSKLYVDAEKKRGG